MEPFTFFKGEAEIKDLPVGETGFTVGWCFSIDEDQVWWVRGDYGYSSKSGGTVNVRLTREEGFVRVDSSSIDVKFVRQGKPRDSWHPIRVEWE